MRDIAITLLFAAALAAAPSTVTAAPSTSQGQVSVTQVMEMLDKAPAERTAQQVLTAYLAGVGETAAAMVRLGSTVCRAPLGLSTATVRQAIRGAAAGEDAGETAATPLIIRDMLDRADCRPS